MVATLSPSGDLLKTLHELPPEFPLTPVKGNKAPYRDNWQHEEPLSRDALASEIKLGRAKGYGLRTGTVSGLVAVDLDGVSAHSKLLELSGGQELPQTVAFTSGRPGRAQYLFRVPEQYWSAIQTKKYQTGVKGDDGKSEQVELRWKNLQSVLPPSVHPITGQYSWVDGCSPWQCEIPEAPAWIIEKMLIETQQHQPQRINKLTSINSGSWSDQDWAISYLDALSPSRADDYDSWLAVGMALHSVSDSLFNEWDKWSHQSAKYKAGGCEKKWKSFNRDGVSIGSLAHMAKQDGWRSPFEVSTAYRSRTKVNNQNPKVEAVSIKSRVIEILKRDLSESDQQEALLELRKSTDAQPREIQLLVETIESEVDLTEGRTDRAAELESLRKIGDRKLTLSRYLHPYLAQPLERVASWMGVDVEALLTVLLPTSASLLHPETRVIVKECIDFVEPMVLYTGVVSESGNRKSPIFKTITKGLRKLQDEEDALYNSAQEEYKAKQRAWQQDKSKDKGEAPEPPLPPREYFVDNVTSEAVNRIKAQQPDHGILIRKDELSGLFGSYGEYKGGRGSDKEGILSGWNGDGIKVNRASGSRLSLAHDASSITGAIQPGKLRKMMGDLEDEQGEWGRFLWHLAPLRSHRLPDNDTRFEIGDLLEGVYRKLDNLASVQYRFTLEAQRIYDDWHWELEQRKLAEPRQGMRAAIAKMEGYTARLAGILHILWEVGAGSEVPGQYIPIERMQAAKALAEFYLGQVQLIHLDAEAAQGEITPVLESILRKARQLGQLSTSNAQSSIKALRGKGKSSKILEYFRELATMGYGKVEGKTFIPVSQSINNGQQVSKSAKMSESLPQAGVEFADRGSVNGSVNQQFADRGSANGQAAIREGLFTEDVVRRKADQFADRQGDAETIDIESSQQLSDKNADQFADFTDQFADQPENAGTIDKQSSQRLSTQFADFTDRVDQFLEAHQIPIPSVPTEELGESVQVWHNDQWVPAVLLETPNDHSDPKQRVTGWKARIIETRLDCYFWNVDHIRR